MSSGTTKEIIITIKVNPAGHFVSASQGITTEALIWVLEETINTVEDQDCHEITVSPQEMNLANDI